METQKPPLVASDDNREIVAVVGAGVIGRGVAHAFADAGFSVILTDLAVSALDSARSEIARSASVWALFERSRKLKKAADVLSRICFTVDLEEAAQAAIVVENVTEDMDVKHGLYAQLDRICHPETIFVVNTSAIQISGIADWTARPDRVIGIHFMNPVPLKDTVEIIRGTQTSDDTFQFTNSLLERVGKRCVLVGDSPGFVSNRVLMLTINEAACTVADGVATAIDVDQIFKRCFGHKMGPLETADLIGLDTVVRTLRVLLNAFKDQKFVPCPLLVRMTETGLLGRKSGCGFYQYEPTTGTR